MTAHSTTVRYYGKTIFEANYGLPAKHAWGFECSCGDGDTTGYKRDIIAIAKAHADNIFLKVINKNGKVAK